MIQLNNSSDLGFLHAMKAYHAMMNISAIRCLNFFEVFDAIPNDRSIDITGISKTTGASPDVLERLLNVVVAAGLIETDGRLQYKHTNISRGYRKGSPAADTFNVMCDEGLATACKLPEWFNAHGKSANPSAHDCAVNPWTWCNGIDGKSLFEVWPAYPERYKAFQHCLKAIETFRPYVGFYDFGSLSASREPRERPLIVDIGGANGEFAQAVINEYPNLEPKSIVVQDLYPSIKLAETNTALSREVRLQVHDFFSPQPVQHALAYHIRACLHDYDDIQCVKILEQVVPAMASDSKLLIAEYVMPDLPARGQNERCMDLLMMMFGGRERTLTQWSLLLEKTGLQMERVHYASQKPWAIIEAVLKSDGVTLFRD